MNRQEFSEALRNKISGLSQDEIEGRISFYNEIIDDHMEDGMSEEEAVNSLGSVDSVADQIMAELPLTKLIGDKVNTGSKTSAGRIVFLICMFPVWIILLVLILALYVIIWALVAALYAMVAAFAAVAVSSIPGSIHLFVQGRNSEAVLVIAVGIFLAGLTVAMIIGSNAAARGAARLTKRVALGFKSIFVKKRTPEKTVEGGAQA